MSCGNVFNILSILLIGVTHSQERFPPSMVTKKFVLESHSTIDDGEKLFNETTLAYITPWNAKGYDLARRLYKKLDIVSPVWFEVRPSEDERSCFIGGLENVDLQFVRDLQEKMISVAPRFLFEGWNFDQLSNLLSSETFGSSCGRAMERVVLDHGFNGAVVELWAMAMGASNGDANEFLLELFATWAQAFHEKSLLVIVPVPPPIDYRLRSALLTRKEFEALASIVDFVQVMTYDFPSRSAIAPYEWVEECIRALMIDGEESSKLLIGLNYYGYEHNAVESRAVLATDFISRLENPGSVLEWDSTVAEHHVRNGDIVLNFPSVTSLEMRILLASKYNIGIAIWELGQGLNHFSHLL